MCQTPVSARACIACCQEIIRSNVRFMFKHLDGLSLCLKCRIIWELESSSFTSKLSSQLEYSGHCQAVCLFSLLALFKYLLESYSVMQLSMLCPRGGPWDEVGTLNVLGHPGWGILANFEHKCWPRDQEVWTMLKRRKRRGFWMWGAWTRMFRHLESTARIPRSSNFPVAIKWKNKRNLTNRCFF